jgi:hypothetical protein
MSVHNTLYSKDVIIENAKFIGNKNKIILPTNTTEGLIINDGVIDYIHISTDIPKIKLLTKVIVGDDINMLENKINNVADPILSLDCVNKRYCDSNSNLNSLNLSEHIIFMSGWKEYTSNINTVENFYSSTNDSKELMTPDGETTSIYIDNLGTYRITFDAQYSITLGKCDCEGEIKTLLINLNDNIFTTHSPEFGDIILYPGNYKSGGGITHTGRLILDAEGDPTAVFIIKSGGALEVAAMSDTILRNNAQSSNVYWIITGAIGIGRQCTLVGTYISTAAIIAGANFKLDGRLITVIGAISLSNITVAIPLGSSIYTDESYFKNVLLYTLIGAISAVDYTPIGPNSDWIISTEIGAISGFNLHIDGIYPETDHPYIDSDISMYVSGIVIDSTIHHMFGDNIGDNYNIHIAYTITINSESEKKISIYSKQITRLGGITIGKRSLFAMPLAVL